LNEISRLGKLFDQRRRIAGSALGKPRVSRQALTALSSGNDPYRQEIKRVEGEWFARWFEELCPQRRIHLRGFHYLLVTSSIVKPNGSPYRNVDDEWEWLSKASVAARWLGLLPFNRIVDQRNDEPIWAPRNSGAPRGRVHGGTLFLPEADDVGLTASLDNFYGRQPFTLCCFGEKGSLRPTLEPICRRFGVNLFLPTGEISATQTSEMAWRAHDDGRKLIVFTVSDCDPSGYQMPVSIARKLMALRDMDFPTLQYAVLPIALSPTQADELGLPTTPLKEAEKRGDRWREAHGREQTEIDAAIALQPQWLERTIVDTMSRFYDDSLEHRVREARDEWRENTEQLIEDYFGEELDSMREVAERIGQMNRYEAEGINQRLDEMADSFELPDQPPLDGVAPDDDGAGVLIDSAMSWFEQTARLQARKAYVNDDLGEEQP
jgi:hypothetical protein